MQDKLKIPYILKLHNRVDLFNFNLTISQLLSEYFSEPVN